MTRVERMMAVVLLLQERGRGCEELARLLEVSRRTVIRDIQAICEMGIPILSREGAGGGYSLSPQYGIRPLELSWKEALLLVMALDGLSKLSDAPYSAERASLSAKLIPLIPGKHLARLDDLRESVVVEVPDREQRAPMLDALVEVVGTGNWICLEYDGTEGKSSRHIRLDRIYTDRGFWYLNGYDGQVSRTMRVDRVLSISSVEPPEDVHPEVPYDDPSHPLVRVVLTKRGARVVQRDPHMGGNVDVGLEFQELAFRCPYSEFEWYAGFFGSIGKDAIVLEPEELRRKMLSRSLEQVRLYEKSSDSSER